MEMTEQEIVNYLRDASTQHERRSEKECFVLGAAASIMDADNTLMKELFVDAQAAMWIPVTERLPKNEVDVLILAERRCYGIRKQSETIQIVAMAFHTDGKTNTEDSGFTWELTDAEYDEDADAYIIPEGWWESVRYGEEYAAVDDFVTHWMPLPEAPKEETK